MLELNHHNIFACPNTEQRESSKKMLFFPELHMKQPSGFYSNGLRWLQDDGKRCVTQSICLDLKIVPISREQ